MRLAERKSLPSQTSEWQLVKHDTLRPSTANISDLRLVIELRTHRPLNDSHHSEAIAEHCRSDDSYIRFQNLSAIVSDKVEEIAEAKKEANEFLEAIETERSDLATEGSARNLSELKLQLRLCQERIVSHESDLKDIREELEVAKRRLKVRALDLVGIYRAEHMAQLRAVQQAAMEKLQSTANEAIDELATSSQELKRVAGLANQGFEIMKRIGVTEND
jgi:hypothetical protein